ncbi:hypothetical protein PoB_001346900 [Plakobranchus ocellatus]|uniref:Uncharacterized protein n=1 Tax=Plakobranchus ocellatus TaxID=259542 RepID=A0AAV3YYZ4_9GAST|nr:hypothetical protein PoB_001346900 [Plakobranchus ocellatus]
MTCQQTSDPGFQALPQSRASLRDSNPRQKDPVDFRAGSLSATCLHASWKFGNALVSVVANNLKINRAATPETNQAPKGSGSLRAQI